VKLQRALILQRLFHFLGLFADSRLQPAGYFFGRSFGLLQAIAGDLPDRFLDRAPEFLRSTFNAISVHGAFLQILTVELPAGVATKQPKYGASRRVMARIASPEAIHVGAI
jgi:hypothetical protein